MALALHPQRTGWLQRVQVPLQVALYIGFFLVAEQLVNWLRLPLPANIVGMLLLLALIMLRVMPLDWVKAGSSWLLAEMLLFFVPAVVAVVNYCATAARRRLAHHAGDRHQYAAGAGNYRAGGGSRLSLRNLAGGTQAGAQP